MTVPETALSQDDGPMLGKHQVGFSGQIGPMEPIAEAEAM
jgi:hypothetical protein